MRVTSSRPLGFWLSSCRMSSWHLPATWMCWVCRIWGYLQQRNPRLRYASSLSPAAKIKKHFDHFLCQDALLLEMLRCRMQIIKSRHGPAWTSTPPGQACQQLWSWDLPVPQNSRCRWHRWPRSSPSLWLTDTNICRFKRYSLMSSQTNRWWNARKLSSLMLLGSLAPLIFLCHKQNHVSRSACLVAKKTVCCPDTSKHQDTITTGWLHM